MKLLLINSVLGFGSTGSISLNIAKEYEENGYEVKIAYGRNKPIPDEARKYGVRIGSDVDVYYHVMYSRLTGKHGLASKQATKEFLKWADGYDPDVLWLHNIHGYYINYELLFEWIKSRPQMKVKWTLHDCWAFTGHCSHFSYVKCDRWKEECHDCIQLDQYPNSISDNSADNYRRKKAAFSGVQDMSIITPSNWLKELVQKSFLSEYPVEVVYNTIDTDVFRATDSSFKQDHGLADKKMILGVASVWNDRKGLADFVKLSKMLDDKRYRIVLVGLSSKQIEDLGKTADRILALPRTGNPKELAEIYSVADVFVNPSYEETFGLTTAEAQACGTYAIVYRGTACEEVLDKDNGRAVVDLDEIYNAVCEVTEKH